MPLVIVGVILPVAIGLPRLGINVPPWVVFVVLAALIGAMFAWLLRTARFAKRIAKTDGFLCPNCHYDLHGLADRGDCPECGEAYVREELERRWNMWLLSQSKNQQTVRPRDQSALAVLNKTLRPRKPRAPTLVWLTILPVAAIAPTALLTVAALKTGLALVWLPPLAAVSLIVLAIWNMRRVMRLLRRVKAADGMLCLHCLGDLREEGDRVTCPACGRGDSREVVRQSWRRYTMGGHAGQ